MTTTLTEEDLREFENLPADQPSDETDIGLRAYITRLSEEKLAEYDPEWNDEQVEKWETNFKSDGGLMLVCCERDVNVLEYRAVLEEWLAFRQKRGG